MAVENKKELTENINTSINSLSILPLNKDTENQEIKQILETVFEADQGILTVVTTTTVFPAKFFPDFIKPVPVCSIFSLIERSASEPEIPMIWSGIKKGTFGFVYGPAKSGKTIFCENLGMSIAAGKNSFLGISLNSSEVKKVLFISLEEYWQNRTERNKKQLSVFFGINEHSFPYLVVDETFPYSILDNKSWKIFEDTIISSGADLVIVDSFTRMIRNEIEKSNVGSEILLRLKELTNRLKITLIVIHHSSKIMNTPLDIANMAGSRVVGQEADFILGINKLSNNTRYFKEVSTRYKQESELVTTFSIDQNLWLVKRHEMNESRLFQPVDHRENPEHQELVFSAIEGLAADVEEVKISDLMDRLNGTLGRTVIYGYLRNLEESGLIDRTKKGIIKIL